MGLSLIFVRFLRNLFWDFLKINFGLAFFELNLCSFLTRKSSMSFVFPRFSTIVSAKLSERWCVKARTLQEMRVWTMRKVPEKFSRGQSKDWYTISFLSALVLIFFRHMNIHFSCPILHNTMKIYCWLTSRRWFCPRCSPRSTRRGSWESSSDALGSSRSASSERFTNQQPPFIISRHSQTQTYNFSNHGYICTKQDSVVCR